MSTKYNYNAKPYRSKPSKELSDAVSKVIKNLNISGTGGIEENPVKVINVTSDMQEIELDCENGKQTRFRINITLDVVGTGYRCKLPIPINAVNYQKIEIMVVYSEFDPTYSAYNESPIFVHPLYTLPIAFIKQSRTPNPNNIKYNYNLPVIDWDDTEKHVTVWFGQPGNYYTNILLIEGIYSTDTTINIYNTEGDDLPVPVNAVLVKNIQILPNNNYLDNNDQYYNNYTSSLGVLGRL